MSKPFIYLASRSPRREELLTQIGVGYQVFVHAPEELVDLGPIVATHCDREPRIGVGQHG